MPADDKHWSKNTARIDWFIWLLQEYDWNFRGTPLEEESRTIYMDLFMSVTTKIFSARAARVLASRNL